MLRNAISPGRFPNSKIKSVIDIISYSRAKKCYGDQTCKDHFLTIINPRASRVSGAFDTAFPAL